MFETREQYLSILNSATPEEKQQLLQQYGDGSDLPTEADNRESRIGELEQQGYGIPEVLDENPQADNTFTPVNEEFDTSTLPQGNIDVEPLTDEELEKQAEYDRLTKDQSAWAEIERNVQARKEEYALRDQYGEVVTDFDGNIVEREVSTGEKMINSISNIVADTQSGFADLGIGVNEVVQKLVGDETLEQWAEDADSDFLRAFTDEGTEELIRAAEVAESTRDEHTGSYTGEDSDVAAAFVNSVTSIGSSALINTITLGGGLPAQFVGGFYRDYNGAVAETKGKSLRDLREDGEDSFWAPAAFGIVAGLSEKVGLKGAGKAITDKIKKPIAKKIAHRLLSGNKEGLTELFQTGLEGASLAHAKGEDAAEAFAEGVFSREGLESYLQGFTGGATLAGKGQDQKANIQKIQKAAAAMRAPVDSQRIDELTAKRVELSKVLSSTTDPQVKDLIGKQIKDVESELKHIIPQANGIVRKMTDPQVDAANNIFEQAKAVEQQGADLFAKYKDGTITKEEFIPAKKALQDELNKLNDKGSKLQAQVVEQPNVREKDLTSPSHAGIWSTSVKNTIDTAIQGGKDVFDVISDNNVQKWIGSKVRNEFNKLAKSDQEKTTLDDVVAGVLYGTGSRKSQSLLGLLQTADPQGKALPSTYVLGQIDKKINDVLQTETQQRSGRGFDAAIEGEGAVQVADSTDIETQAFGETQEAPAERSALEVSSKLGIEPRVVQKAALEAEKALGTKLPDPSDRKFEKGITDHFRTVLQPAIAKALGKGADFEAYLDTNWNDVLKTLPLRSLSKRQDESKGWAQNTPNKSEFLNYFLSPTSVKKPLSKEAWLEKKAEQTRELEADGITFQAAPPSYESYLANPSQDIQTRSQYNQKIGRQTKRADEAGFHIQLPSYEEYLKSWGAEISPQKKSQRKKALTELLAETVGLKAAKDVLENNAEAQQKFKDVQEIIANENAQEVSQIANDRWFDTFVDDSIAEDDFASQEKATDKILADNKQRKTINTKNDTEFQEGRDWVSNTLTSYFPSEFFTQGIFANAGSSAQQRGFFFTSKADLDQAVTNAKSDPNSVYAKTGRYNYKHKSADKIKVDWSKVDALNKNNQQAFNEMWKTFEKMIADDPKNAPFVAAILKSAQNSQNHLSRTGAPITAFSKNGPWEEEHTMPQSSVARYLFSTIMSGGNLDNALSNTNKNFFQVGLNKTDDLKLKKVKLNSKMPDGWRPSDNSWARYFNDAVNGVDGGIDPNSITFFATGKTVAETFGAGAKNSDKQVVKEAQQKVVAEKVGDQFESLIDRAIGSLDKLLGDRGALHTNFAHIPVNVLIGGLRATKLAYQGSRNLVKALDAGYEKVKDWMTREEFKDFNTQATQEVSNQKTDKQYALDFTDENSADLQAREEVQEQIEKSKEEINTEFNKIIEDKAGIAKDQILSNKEAQSKGKNKGRFKLFIPANIEDLGGLLYTVLPSGKAGEQAWEYFQSNLIKPFGKATAVWENEKGRILQSVSDAFSGYKQTNKSLQKPIKEGSEFNTQDALRVYIANEKGNEVNGLGSSKQELLDFVEGDQKLKAFALELSKNLGENYGKKLDLNNGTIHTDFVSYTNGDLRKEHFSSWKDVSKAMFSEDNLNKYEAVAGKARRVALENVLGRMESGKSRLGNDAETSKLLNFINGASGVTMFWNSRSALLQLLSIGNFIGAPGNSVGNALKTVTNQKQYWKDVKTILKSDYIRARKKGGKIDVAISDILDSADGQNGIIKKLIEFGYTPTKAADSVAIALGGATLYGSLVRSGISPKEALLRVQEVSEESQQSSRADKISQAQTSTLGRLLFAFANTPLQYARITKKAAQDLINNRGSRRKNAAKIAWYGALQNIAFSSLQNAIWTAFGDDEEENEEKVQTALFRYLDSYHNAFGGIGIGLSAVANSIKKYSDKGDAVEAATAALNVAPPLSIKLNSVKNAFYSHQRGDNIRAATNALAVTNLPLERLIRKTENLQAFAESETSVINRLMLLAGWSPYSLGVDSKEDTFSGGDSLFDDEGSLFDGDDESLFKRGEQGQAFKDGTIEVDPNLSPIEREKTIAHEKKHVSDMKENGLDYDENYVHYKGKKFARKNGKIRQGGEWKPEGDKSLPWEAAAYAAEPDSPLNTNGDDDKKSDYERMREQEAHLRKVSRETAGKYGTTDHSGEDFRYVASEPARGTQEFGGRHYRPKFVGYTDEHEEVTDGPAHFQAAKDWSKNWNQNPETLGRDQRRTGISENEYYQQLERQQTAQHSEEAGQEATAGTYDVDTHTINTNPDFKGAQGYGKESLGAHEFAHAGRDLQRGLHVKEIIGDINTGFDKEFQEYANRPHEMYGFMQQMRHDMGLKPGQKVTPEMIEEYKKTGSQNPLLNAKSEKLQEALNTVASVDKPKRKSLDDLYSNNNLNTGYA